MGSTPSAIANVEVLLISLVCLSLHARPARGRRRQPCPRREEGRCSRRRRRRWPARPRPPAPASSFVSVYVWVDRRRPPPLTFATLPPSLPLSSRGSDRPLLCSLWPSVCVSISEARRDARTESIDVNVYWAVQKNLVKGCLQTLDCYCVSCELLSASIADAS